MSERWQVVFQMRSGKSYIVNPIPAEDETQERAASRMVDSFMKFQEEGREWYRLVDSTQQTNCIIRTCDVSHAYTQKVDEEEEARNKVRKKKNDELLEHQLDYYRNLDNGERWKKDKNPWEDD
jgi:hypothetical protein